MANTKDQFEKFKAATLGTSSLSDAINTSDSPTTKPSEKKQTVSSAVSAEPSRKVEPEKPGKGFQKANAEEQVSFFIDKNIKKQIGLLKYELGVQLKDLYEEALTDLLKKFGKI